MESTYIRSSIWILYLTIHVSMQYAELYANINNLELLVNSAVESVFQSMVLAKLVIIRYSTTLPKLILAMKEDYALENYDNPEERQIYLKYNNMAKFFYKITIPTISAGSFMYYLVPLENFVRTSEFTILLFWVSLFL